MNYIRNIILIMAVAVCGCRGGHDARLEELDSALRRNPDSVLSILQSIDTLSLTGRSDRMFHALLCVEASDKSNLRITSDSLVNILVKYYIDGNNERELHERVLFIAGRTFSELGRRKEALDRFGSCLKLAEEKKNLDLQMRIHSQMGHIYFKSHEYLKALAESKKEVRCARELPDSAELFTSLLGLAFTYRMVDKNDSAEMIYSELSRCLPLIDDSVATSLFYTQYASYLFDQAKFEEADSVIAIEDIYIDKSIETPTLTVLRKFAEQRGDTGLAEILGKKLLNSNSMASRRNAARRLTSLYNRANDHEKAAFFAEKTAALSDSLISSHVDAFLSEIEDFQAEDTRSGVKRTGFSFGSDINLSEWLILGVYIFLISCIIFYFGFRRKLFWGNHRHRSDTNSEMGTKEPRRVESDEENRRVEEVKIRNARSSLLRIRKTIIEAKPENPFIFEDHYGEIRDIFSILNPRFIEKIEQLGLDAREEEDAFLIKMDIPQKICAGLLCLSPSGLSSLRSRAFIRLCNEKHFPKWTDYIKSL